MSRQLTEYLLRITFQNAQIMQTTDHFPSLLSQQAPLTSTQILNHIYSTINEPQNYKSQRSHKLSLYSEETNSNIVQKCNCKKSKCLKLYCQCFARGSFCEGCGCDCCQNTKQFGEVRARAIDEMLIKASIPFGSKKSSIKGCNCRKTGCQKKYCQCYNLNIPCNQYCKCSNCQNCQPLS